MTIESSNYQPASNKTLSLLNVPIKGAALYAHVKNDAGEGFEFHHIVNGWEIDGDRYNIIVVNGEHKVTRNKWTDINWKEPAPIPIKEGYVPVLMVGGDSTCKWFRNRSGWLETWRYINESKEQHFYEIGTLIEIAQRGEVRAMDSECSAWRGRYYSDSDSNWMGHPNVQAWLTVLGYPFIYQNAYAVADISSVIAANSSVYHHDSHGGPLTVSLSVTPVGLYIYNTEFIPWMSGRDAFRFAIPTSCHGCANPTSSTSLAYALTKAGSAGSTIVGLNIASQWNGFFNESLFNYISQGNTIKHSFDLALIENPTCTDHSFYGDTAVTLPQGPTTYNWRQAISFSDPDSRWHLEEGLYDNYWTYGPSAQWLESGQWTPFVYYDLSSLSYNKIQLYWPSATQVDIDLYYDGAWHDFIQHESLQQNSTAYALYGDLDVAGYSYDLTGSQCNTTRVRMRQMQFSSDGSYYIEVCALRLYIGGISAPTVTTQAATDVLATSCTGNGNITAVGGGNATRRGFCYKVGTSGDPTTADSVAYDDGDFGTGAYTKAIIGLTPGTGYRVRAYAVNPTGTGYGTTVQVTTLTSYIGLYTVGTLEILRPNATGDETTLTKSGGTYNWEMVDEAVADDSTTYVYKTGTSWARDLYNLPAHSGSGTINKITVYIRWTGTDSGYARASIKTGGTAYNSSDFGLVAANVWQNNSNIWTLNPQTGIAWTWTDIDNLQIGVSSYSYGTGKCTQVYVEVDNLSSLCQRRYKAATFSTFVFPDPAGIGFTAATDGYSMLAGWGLVGGFQKLLSGTLNAAGSLGRKITTSLGGTLSSTGILNAALRIPKVLYGTLTSSGTLVGKRLKFLAGVLNLSGTLNRLIKKTLAGTLNFIGALVAGTLKFYQSLAGTLNLTGALSTLYRYSKSIAGTLNLSGSLIRLVKKNLAGILNSSGTLGRKIFKKLIGTLNLSGALSMGLPLFLKSLAGTLNLSGSLGRKIRKSLAGTISFIGSLAKVFETLYIQRYTVEVHDSSGALLAILKDTYGITLEETVNMPKYLTFLSPADETKLAFITRANEIWVRDVKNNVILAKVRLLRSDDTR